MATALARLTQAGFQQKGSWCRQDGKAICQGDFPRSPAVYAFVVNGEVKYIGSAQRSIRRRMKNYERRMGGDQSNRPVHAALTEAVRNDPPVEVYVLLVSPVIDTGPHGLPVDYVLGLEAGLIQDLQPAWNRRGRKLLLDKSNVTPGDQSSPDE